MPTVNTNGPYQDRIVVQCDPEIGPFVQPGPGTLGSFDPIRDLEVYVDGQLVPIRTWSFDALNNRYLLFMDKVINTQGVIQVIHHMPNPPFQTFRSSITISSLSSVEFLGTVNGTIVLSLTTVPNFDRSYSMSTPVSSTAWGATTTLAFNGTNRVLWAISHIPSFSVPYQEVYDLTTQTQTITDGTPPVGVSASTWGCTAEADNNGNPYIYTSDAAGGYYIRKVNTGTNTIVASYNTAADYPYPTVSNLVSHGTDDLYVVGAGSSGWEGAFVQHVNRSTMTAAGGKAWLFGSSSSTNALSNSAPMGATIDNSSNLWVSMYGRISDVGHPNTWYLARVGLTGGIDINGFYIDTQLITFTDSTYGRPIAMWYNPVGNNLAILTGDATFSTAWFLCFDLATKTITNAVDFSATLNNYTVQNSNQLGRYGCDTDGNLMYLLNTFAYRINAQTFAAVDNVDLTTITGAGTYSGIGTGGTWALYSYQPSTHVLYVVDSTAHMWVFNNSALV